LKGGHLALKTINNGASWTKCFEGFVRTIAVFVVNVSLKRGRSGLAFADVRGCKRCGSEDKMRVGKRGTVSETVRDCISREIVVEGRRGKRETVSNVARDRRQHETVTGMGGGKRGTVSKVARDRMRHETVAGHEIVRWHMIALMGHETVA
jgi:hypothetical protein